MTDYHYILQVGESGRNYMITTKYLNFTFIFLLFITWMLTGCNEKTTLPEKGSWRGDVYLHDQKLGFRFVIESNGERQILSLVNGDEVIKAGYVQYENDTMIVPLHVFDARLVFPAYSGNKLDGYFVKDYLEEYQLKVTAEKGNKRFQTQHLPEIGEKFTGSWEVVFTGEGDTTSAVGIFNSDEKGISGTFLTAVGDYRFLQGVTTEDGMLLSAFDGSHAFLFDAQLVTDSILSGNFYSGKSWHQTWQAKRNDNAHLSDPSSLTYLKDGYKTIDFRFPDTNGDTLSPQMDKYKGRVRILQVFGTWCPNCMDETKYLVDWYGDYQNEVSIIGLAFESKDDFGYAVRRVNKMKSMWNVPWEIVIAGTSNKAAASEKLPMLNQVLAFPTLIVLDKEGKVRWIHTGFNGPGTGDYFEEFKTTFERLIEKLLEE